MRRPRGLLLCLFVGAVAAASGCGSSQRQEPWETTATVDASGVAEVAHAGWTIKTAPSAQGRLRMRDGRDAPGVRTASSALERELSGTTVAGRPVALAIDGGALGAGGATVQVRLRAPVPRGRAAALVYLDPAGRRWVPVPSSLSGDRRTVSARVGHLSLWDSIEYGAGWLLDTRVSPPSCRGPRPDWVGDVTYLDDKNAPLRWCTGHDPDHGEDLQVKLAVNRSYAVGAQALAAPAVTRASVFGGGPSELLNGLASRAADATLAPFTRSFDTRIPVMGGQEIAFSFTRDQVEQRQGRALIHVSPDAPDAAAGLVFWAVQNAGERGMLGTAGAYLTAYAAIGQCEADVLRPFERGDWAEGLAGLVGCVTGNRDTTTKLVGRALVRQFPDEDPRALGRLAAKLGSALRYVAIAGAGFKVATWLADRRLPAAAFEAHAFVVPTLRVLGSDSFGGMPNPGTLRQAIARFGRPSSMKDDGSSVDCFVRWDALGIRALFQDFGATGSPSCVPADAFTLSEASLTGSRWMTNAGVRIGDPLGTLRAAYPDAAHPADCVTDQVPDGSWWRLLRTPDPLGGPGSFICTLAAIVHDGRVAQFELSSSAASE